MEWLKFWADMAWPAAIFSAWLASEYVHRRVGLPRISVYALIGFILAPSQMGLLPATQPVTILLLAHIAFGLILFECGYRINLRWLRTNPWLVASSLGEASLTFVAVYLVAHWMEQPTATALLLAALSMATSPATVVRVINEQKSSGQVTERLLHLSAMNSVLAVFAFKVIVATVVFQTSGNFWEATYSSLIVFAASMFLGVLFGFFMPTLLGSLQRGNRDNTLAFALAVIFLVALTQSLKLSPVLAALTFGLTARHRHIALSPSERGFGVLGDLLSVFLFVFIASTLAWKQVIAGISLGLTIILVRQISKISGIALFAHMSGISLRKGLLVGIATAPLSAFVILLLEQTRHLGIHFVDQLAPLATAAFTLEVLGPLLVQIALVWAHETHDKKDA